MSTAALMLTNLDLIFHTLTVPTGHRLRERWDLLRKIKPYIDLPPSEEILKLLEDAAAMDVEMRKQPSNSMKEAYLNLAVQMTRDIVRSPGLDSFAAVTRISAVWNRAEMQRLKRADAATGDLALGSDKLRSWLNVKVNEVMSAVLNDDAAMRLRIDSYFEGIQEIARESLIRFEYEQISQIRVEVPYDGQNPSTPGMGTRGTDDAGASTSSGIKHSRSRSRSRSRSTPTENNTSTSTSTAPKSRRTSNPWSLREEEALKRGVKDLGRGNWKAILLKYKQFFKPCRNNIDLKDKWIQLSDKKDTSPIRNFNFNL